MRQSVITIFTTLLFICLLTPVQASELVYQPLNPSFGGNPFNASWMIQQAEAQNTFTEARSTTSSYSRDPLDTFSENLNRQILSRLSSQLARSAFGEDSLEPGHYELGDYVIDVVPGDDGIHINIYDNGTGNETGIVVPYY
jgi:curli production assembly/transport component CsgF